MVDIGDALSKVNAALFQGTGQLRNDIKGLSKIFNDLALEKVQPNPLNTDGSFRIVSDGRGNIDPPDEQGYSTSRTGEMALKLRELSENAQAKSQLTNAKILRKAYEFVDKITYGDSLVDDAERKPITQRGQDLKSAQARLSQAHVLLNELKGMMPK
jgi:hypothetical protein